MLIEIKNKKIKNTEGGCARSFIGWTLNTFDVNINIWAYNNLMKTGRVSMVKQSNLPLCVQ